ncbi:MAG: phosphodiester glycosidase family protein [Ferruginibacter sp.]|nr:phosphodiester glycosidase family protein [Chitinophagaceae bacterium]
MQKLSILFLSFLFCLSVSAQLKWQNVDSLFRPLPASVHVYKTTSLLGGKPNIAYYVEADLKDRKLDFSTDTTYNRRLTPSKFYEKNEHPLVVINTTFFSFATNQNLNVVIKNTDVVAFNAELFRKSKTDSTIKIPVYGSAIGISNRRIADIAWIKTDSAKNYAMAMQEPEIGRRKARRRTNSVPGETETTRALNPFQRWRMRTAVGGGPVLLQNGEIMITNNEELKFAGKAIDDKHPRTAMGYTKGNKLILLVIQGRAPGIAEGATLTQEAQIFKDLGCREAINLDGGGSSCMLINGKETIKVSDVTGQRPVPAVFIIKAR